MKDLINLIAAGFETDKILPKKRGNGFFYNASGNGFSYSVEIKFGWNGNKVAKSPFYEISVLIDINGTQKSSKKRVYDSPITNVFNDCSTFFKNTLLTFLND